MALIERLPTEEIESVDPTVTVTTTFLTNTIRSLFFTATRVATPGKESEIDKKLKHIPLEEVLDHDSYGDCWVIIYDRVYDITPFLAQVSYHHRLHNCKCVYEQRNGRRVIACYERVMFLDAVVGKSFVWIHSHFCPSRVNSVIRETR
jgi:hypothetical protein